MPPPPPTRNLISEIVDIKIVQLIFFPLLYAMDVVLKIIWGGGGLSIRFWKKKSDGRVRRKKKKENERYGERRQATARTHTGGYIEMRELHGTFFFFFFREKTRGGSFEIQNEPKGMLTFRVCVCVAMCLRVCVHIEKEKMKGFIIQVVV